MKKILLGLTVSLTLTVAYGQQDPQFTQNAFLNLSFNPGYAGTNDTFSATGVYRNQWVGFPGAPKTFLFCADAPIKALHGGGGIKFTNDKIGNFNFTTMSAAYSYHLCLGKNGLLGIGLEGELVRSAVTNNWLTPSGTVITNSNAIITNYNLGLGSYYRTERLYIGISATNLYQYFKYQSDLHYYLMTGYNFHFFSRIKVVPSILIKSDAAVTTIEPNLTVHWNNMFWAGTSYRLQDAIVVMAGFGLHISKGSTLKIGYAYDFGISDLKAYHNNTHELLMNYSLKIKNKSK